jgi:hypothetical protein
MSGGPLYPSSQVFVTSGKVGPGVHTGVATTGLRRTRGIQVVASLDTNADVELCYEMPPVLPSGSGKLRLLMRTAGTGAAKIAVDWVSVAVGEDPSAAVLLSEGTSTVTVSGGDSDKFLELKVPLDADTLVAGEVACVRLRFVSTGWTLDQPLTLWPSVIWE